MANRPSAFKLLVLSGLREIVRDFRLFFFILLFPLLFLGAFGLMSTVIPKSEVLQISLFEYMFPGILIFALLSTGFFGTALPLIELRKNGTMRLFKLAPVKTSVFILSQITVRIIFAVLQILLFLLLGLLFGVVHWTKFFPVFGVSLIGMVMILILGFLLGGLFNKIEIAGGVLGAISAPLLMLSGVLLPFYIMPDVMKDIAYAIPFTYFGESLRQIMFDEADSIFNVYINSFIMLGFSAILFVITHKTFKWVRGAD